MKECRFCREKVDFPRKNKAYNVKGKTKYLCDEHAYMHGFCIECGKHQGLAKPQHFKVFQKKALCHKCQKEQLFFLKKDKILDFVIKGV